LLASGNSPFHFEIAGVLVVAFTTTAAAEEPSAHGPGGVICGWLRAIRRGTVGAWAGPVMRRTWRLQLAL
jgi:hypothetical protein